MKQRKFSISKRVKSFSYAFNGFKILFKEEHNSRIHLIVAICVTIAGFVYHITGFEWIALILSIGLVFSLELINSAIENLSDFVSTEQHNSIKKVKDLAAAAVLFSVITAVIVGLVVFIPKI
ncbi:MAG: diacylglycerol kinase family protein [Cyclobacteriaceae bacterium]|nr:diacylglycerol kinase family protein [Cyclobacteriaceae bacterium]